MDLICNDNCVTSNASGDGKNLSVSEFNCMPEGIPITFKYGDKAIDLIDCKYTESKISKDGYDIITRRCKVNEQLSVEMAAKIYDKLAVDYIIYFENTSNKNTKQISKINTYNLNFTLNDTGQADTDVHYQNPLYTMGDETLPVLNLIRGNEGCKHANLNEMAEDYRILRNGNEYDFTANSCGGEYSPYFIVSWPNGGVVLTIGWSGLWQAHFENKDGNINLSGGMKRGNFYLKPDEKIRTPRIMYNCYTGEPESGYNTFRRVYIRHIAPRDTNGSIILPPNSCPCPDENGTNGDIEINWVQNVMDNTDAEMYWHDAWWHVGGFPSGMGNYTFPIEKCVDPVRYPKGIKILGDISHQKGYKFMLWFAPESYPENSTMAKEYPQYILKLPGAKGGSLNLSNDEARNYITRYLDECIKTYGIDIFRTDSGLGFNDIVENEEPNREGILEIGCFDGLYKLWDKLRELNPDLMIDNCCGGGTRLDLELCSRSYSLWRTDSSVWYHGLGDMVRHPILNQNINSSFNRFIPFTVSATCDYNPYTVRSGFNGGLTLNMDLRKPEFDKTQLRSAYAEVRRLRKYFLGDFYRLINDGTNPKSWCSYQYHLPESNEGCVFVFRRDNSPYSEAVIGLKGIDFKKYYEVDFYRGYNKDKTLILSGAELMSFKATLEGAPDSLLIEYKERLKRQYK